MRQYNRRDYHIDNRNRYHNNYKRGGGVGRHGDTMEEGEQQQQQQQQVGSSDNVTVVLEGKRREKSFFIMKCNNEKNMSISFNRGIWATTKSNEKRLARAFKESDQVFLIFSVQGSGRFQGVAKMISAISEEYCEDFGSHNLGGVFNIEWIHQKEIPFQNTQHLVNPWNDNKKVQISRDAQEVESKVGKALVDLWLSDIADNPSREEEIALSPALRCVDSQHGGVSGELKQQMHQEDQQQQHQQREFYAQQQEMYANTSNENEAQQYVEEFPIYSPPPFSPQYIATDYQQVEMQQHYAPAPPHMGFQQPPYPGAPMYGPPPPGQGNIPAGAAYRQQEYYSFQYSPPRQCVATTQHER